MKKEIVSKYIEEATVRFYKKQKLQYADELLQQYQELGYQGMVKSKRSGFFTAYNVMIGNFKLAKRIMVVPYDTPAKVFWPNYKYYPQSGDFGLKRSFMPTYMPMIIAYVILLLMVYGLPAFIGPELESVLFAFSTFYLFAVLLMIMKGFANRKNAVRNNTSLAVAYEMAEAMTKEQRKETAFVFLDTSGSRAAGATSLMEFMANSKRKTEMIVLYCLGRGTHISFGYSKGCRKNAQELSRKYKGKETIVLNAMDGSKCVRTPMELLSNAVMVSSGEKQSEHLTVLDTCCARDVDYQEEMLDNLVKMLLDYIK